jgi:hypothetical protein
VIAVLSDEQLELIEDALTSALGVLDEHGPLEPLLRMEIERALGLVTAARTFMNT